MSATQRPLHRLPLDEASADHLIDGRFDEGGADRFSVPIALAEVRNELPVVANVDLKLRKAAGQFLCRRRLRLNQTEIQNQAVHPFQHFLNVSVPQQVLYTVEPLRYLSAGLELLLL